MKSISLILFKYENCTCTRNIYEHLRGYSVTIQGFLSIFYLPKLVFACNVPRLSHAICKVVTDI